MNSERIELGAFIFWPLMASALCFAFQANPLVSIIIFYGVPSALLSVIARPHIRKAAVFSLVMSIPLMTIVDYIAHVTQTWYVPTSFPRILGYGAIETTIWCIFWVYFTVLFYEHFIHHKVAHKILHPHMKLLVIGLLVLTVIFTAWLILLSNVAIPYFYFFIGITTVILPIFFEFSTHARTFMTFMSTGVYFFYLSLVYEITALKLGIWSFPGTEFIGRVSMMGVSFPLEELLFWIILGGFVVLSYFEIFDDAQRS